MLDDYQSSDHRTTEQTTRVLENTRDVILFVNKRQIGTIRIYSEPHIFESGGLSWRTYQCCTVSWTRESALALLSGKTIASLLLEQYILLSGCHRPVYHEAPGIESATIAEIWTNVEGLSHYEMFERILAHHMQTGL